MTSILVTGVGGDVAQGVIKALRLSDKPYIVHGCDINGYATGRAFVETFHVVPKPTNATYDDVLDEICQSVGASVVIPCTEPEIAILSLARCLPSGIKVLCQPWPYVRKYGDKLHCYDALRGKISLADYVDGTDSPSLRAMFEYSDRVVVVKSRQSWGSKGQKVVSTLACLQGAIAKTHLPVVQKYIAGDEFSVGVFSCDQFATAIAFKRELGPAGNSWCAETSYDLQVLDYALRVAAATGLRGSINVQVRKGYEGVRLLEINPRFSGLVAARAACGFHDVEWSLDLLLGQTPRLRGSYRAIKFHRYFHELIDYGDGPRALPEWSPQFHVERSKE